MTLDDIKALVPAVDAWAIEDQIRDTLTGGNTLLQDDAGAAAARYVFAALVRCGATQRQWSADELEILAEALAKRAIYELYTRSEIEASATDKRDDAITLLRALLGDCVTAATSPSADARFAGAAVAQDRPCGCGGGVGVLRGWDVTLRGGWR